MFVYVEYQPISLVDALAVLDEQGAKTNLTDSKTHRESNRPCAYLLSLAMHFACTSFSNFSVQQLTNGRQVVILTLLYSWAGLGIAIVNDFKSVEGDREMGLQSLPVAFGVEKAKWICVASIDATQLGIAAWLYSIGETTYAAVLTAFVLPQIFAQWKYFLPDPVGNDVK